MVFSSAIFIFAFLPIVFVVYRLLPGIKSRNIFLSLASIVFYAFGQLQYVPLFLSSVLINYFAGVLLAKTEKHRKAVLVAAIILNLGILAVFKYTDFAIATFNKLSGADFALSGIILPIGISFFTFQGMSYTIDVYRGTNEYCGDFWKLLLYIAFFPQLVAGPIVKYHDIAQQIEHRETTPEDTAYGIERFIEGFAKKMLIANTMGYVADYAFSFEGAVIDFRLAWLGAICYTLQIYFDFSAYSDMAIGMGRMFGFRFLENFDLPYTALSIRDFWRRWHISLSTWFKEYLYIPLGGNRKGRGRTALNKLVVFFCTGIWHGANWTFVLWGLLHGLLSSLESLGVIPVERMKKTGFGRVVCRVYTLLAVTLLFVLFKADTIGGGIKMIASMFSFRLDPAVSVKLAQLMDGYTVFILAAAVVLSAGVFKKLRPRLVQGGTVKTAVTSVFYILLFVLCAACLAQGGFNPFIYFQF